MRAVLRRPDFRLLFAGMVASMVGESVLFLVLAIWVKELTGSSSLAGTTIFALVAPAVFAPVLGWVVDRFRRRTFLITANLLTATALLPLLLVQHRSDIGIIYAVAAFYGASGLMVSGALNGLIKEMLPEELLASANGAMQTVRQGLRLVGPIGGAALFTVLGGRSVVALDVCCLIVASVAIAGVKVREAGPAASELHWRAEVVAGIRHLLTQPALRRATAGITLATGVIGFIEPVVFAYVDKGLHRGPAFISVIVCVQGIGGLSGGLLAATVVRRLGEIGALALGVIGFAVGIGALIYPNMLLGFAGAVVVGLGLPLAIVAFSTLIQRLTPPALVGRVSSASDALASTPQALSIGLGAALVAVVDYRLLLVAMTAGLLVAASYLWAGRSLSTPLTSTDTAAPAPVPAPVTDPAPTA